MQLRFVPSESAFTYFEALQGYLETHGCPVAFYSDKHSVFRVARKDAKGGQGMTQFGRALAELNIEILCANSSQAKGRVERVNRTLQDRLVKELRMAGISEHRGRQRVPAGLHRALQRPLRRCSRPPERPAPAAEHRHPSGCARSSAGASSAMSASSSPCPTTASGSCSSGTR